MTPSEYILHTAERRRQHRQWRDRALFYLEAVAIACVLCLSIAATSPAPRSLVDQVRTSWACTKAKRACVVAHPYCAVCSARATFLSRGLEAHHIVPVAVSVRQGHPEWASDPENLVTLCRVCHGWIAHHNRNFREYNANLPATIREVRAAVSNTAQWAGEAP